MTNTKKITIISIAAILLIAAVGVIIALTSFNPVAPSPDSGIVVDGDGNQMDAGVVYNMPKNMVFGVYRGSGAGSGTGDVSVTVRAVITPDDATDQTVKYDFEFLKGIDDGFDSWFETIAAAGEDKTENFVKVKQSQSDSKIFTITFVQAFGMPFKLTVYGSDGNSSASCQIDCAKRVNDVTAEFYNTKTNKKVTDVSLSRDADSVNYAVRYDVVYGVGTVADPDLNFTTQISVSDDFFDWVQSGDHDTARYYMYATGVIQNVSIGNGLESFLVAGIGADFSKFGDVQTLNELCREINSYSGKMLTGTISYTGKFSSGTVTISLNKSAEALPIAVESISLDQGILII